MAVQRHWRHYHGGYHWRFHHGKSLVVLYCQRGYMGELQWSYLPPPKIIPDAMREGGGGHVGWIRL